MSEQATPIPASEQPRRRRSGRKPKSPAFQFYAGDYLTDSKILALSFEERGIWLHLICLAWLNDGLDPDTTVLARSCGLTQREFDRAWRRISTHFELHGERLVNPRQERERSAQAENRERRLAAGQLGNDAKAKKRAQADRNGDAEREPEHATKRCSDVAPDDAMRTQCERNAHAPVSRLPSPVALRIQEDPSGLPPNPPQPQAPNPPRSRRSRVPAADAASVPIPEALLGDLEFGREWSAWLADRKARGKPVTAEAARRQLAKCAELGSERARQAIAASIEHGWTGIFEPKSEAPRNGALPPETSTRAWFEAQSREPRTVEVEGRRTA